MGRTLYHSVLEFDGFGARVGAANDSDGGFGDMEMFG